MWHHDGRIKSHKIKNLCITFSFKTAAPLIWSWNIGNIFVTVTLLRRMCHHLCVSIKRAFRALLCFFCGISTIYSTRTMLVTIMDAFLAESFFQPWPGVLKLSVFRILGEHTVVHIVVYILENITYIIHGRVLCSMNTVSLLPPPKTGWGENID